ncbi:hypothetical protein A5662_12045 [Mycobacteriaceae bacterium 1482268.1]|nr:hypothetical protein A5662_12045 [Mycobacteriaceae bacterium 1482268.1]
MTTSSRAETALTLQEVEELLDNSRTIVLGTLGRSGWPHLAPMWFARHQGAITFMSYRRSQKCRNLLRDNRVTCMVEAGCDYSELRGAVFRGHAVELHGADRLKAAVAVTDRYTDSPTEASAVARHIESRIVYSVAITDVASWDHRKLAVSGPGRT